PCLVGHRAHLPFIAIINHTSSTNTTFLCRRHFARHAAAPNLVPRVMPRAATAYLFISFFTAEVRQRRTFLFPPILREEVLQAHPSEGDYVLVYVTSPAPELAALLRKVRCRFLAYGFGREEEDGNITFKKPSLDG